MSLPELIDSAVNLIVDNRYAFFYLIESIFPINSEEDGLRETKLIERSLNYMRIRDKRSLPHGICAPAQVIFKR